MPLAIAAGFITLAGFALLSVCKWSLFRQGIWVSRAPGRLSDGYAKLYKLAYALLLMGLTLLTLAAVLANSFTA